MPVTAYLSLVRIQLISGLKFRAAAWAKMSTFIFYGFVHVVLIQIFYRFGENTGAGFTAGMNMGQAISYVWLIQVIAHILPAMSVDSEVWQKIRNSDIGIELCRPLDLYAHGFARAAALRLAPLLMQLAPVTLIIMLLPAPYNLQGPASLANLFAAMLALAAALLLACACITFTYTLLMRVTWGEGPTHIVLGLITLLSGAELPLQLWADWTQAILYWQPFAGLVDIPLRLYTGTLPAVAVWSAVGLQLAWTLVFIILGRFLLNRQFRRLVIQGG
ncbi:MAG: hypothetical protein FH749_05810 [Firmicutes bacterium]|nr:hypothetical protein [Bacillota bacterium]